MHRKIILTLLFSALSFYAFAQQENTHKVQLPGTALGLGLTAGATSGMGAAIRRHFATDWGFQVGVIGWALTSSEDSYAHNPNNLREKSAWGALGAQLMRTHRIQIPDNSRFYSLYGAQVMVAADNIAQVENTNLNEDFPFSSPSEEISDSWFYDVTGLVGVGIGVEYYMWNTVGFSLEIPFVVIVSQDTHDDDFTFGAYPLVNASLVYYLYK